jgi:PKD repeat protein
LNVSFKDASSGYPIAWLWDFGDGGNSTSQNPYHTYTRSGLFNVTLSVENHAGTNETVRAKFVKVV